MVRAASCAADGRRMTASLASTASCRPVGVGCSRSGDCRRLRSLGHGSRRPRPQLGVMLFI